MKIHGITVIKNEGDIIGLMLCNAARWCDHIYVYDNGSTDQTWEVVQQLARENERIIAWKQSDKPFDDSMRQEVFEAHQKQAKENDWWCRLDGDEFYIDSPDVFLSKVPRPYHVVWSIHYQYYLTTDDIERGVPTIDPYESFDQLPRAYRTNGSEPRFYRHRERLEWRRGEYWPKHIGPVYPERIRLRHYQYRNPEQIQRRLSTRQTAVSRGGQHFIQNDGEWTEKVVSPESCAIDKGEGVPPLTDDAMPAHNQPAWRNWIKLFMHGTGIWG